MEQINLICPLHQGQLLGVCSNNQCSHVIFCKACDELHKDHPQDLLVSETWDKDHSRIKSLIQDHIEHLQSLRVKVDSRFERIIDLFEGFKDYFPPVEQQEYIIYGTALKKLNEIEMNVKSLKSKSEIFIDTQEFENLITNLDMASYFEEKDNNYQQIVLNFDEKPKFIGQTDRFIWGIDFSPDNKYFAYGGGWDTSVKLVELQNFTKIHHFENHKETVSTIAFSPDSKLIASGSHDKQIYVYDLETKEQKFNFSGHTGVIQRIKFTSDGQKLISLGGFEDGKLIIWDLINGNQSSSIQAFDYGYDFDCKENGSEFIISNQLVDIALIRISTRSIQSEMEISSAEVRFSSDYKYVIVGGDSQRIFILKSLNGQIHRILEGNYFFVSSLSVQNDIIASIDKEFIRLWNIHSGKEISHKSLSFRNCINKVILSKDNKYIGFTDNSRARDVREILTKSIIVSFVSNFQIKFALFELQNCKFQLYQIKYSKIKSFETVINLIKNANSYCIFLCQLANNYQYMLQ
ncbi:Cilia- and flagella-associated protein 52 [Paramecium bursaria]